MQKPKIFITGGHITPALSVIEEINKQKKPWDITVIGRKQALEGEKFDAEEYRLVREMGIRFLPIYTGRILRTITLRGLISILKIPYGLIQALIYIVYFRPNLVLTFGGYIAAPVALAGSVLGVPVILHEQTTELGFANKLISKFSKKILVSKLELLNKLPTQKSVFTGLPVRSQLFKPPAEPSFPYDAHLPLIYITGGTTGAVSLNELIFPLILKLSRRFMIVHQTGLPSFAKAQNLEKSLSDKQRGHYIAAAYFDTDDVAWIYDKAVIVIGRSGANTTTELALLGKIALLVPLPWSAGGEQEKNAQWLGTAGSAVVVDQNKTDAQQVGKILEKILRERKFYELRAKELAKSLPRDGAGLVVSQIEEILA